MSTKEKSPLLANTKLPSPSVKPITHVKKEKEGEFLFIKRSYSELNKVKSKYFSWGTDRTVRMDRLTKLFLEKEEEFLKIKLEVIIEDSLELKIFNFEKRCWYKIGSPPPAGS